MPTRSPAISLDKFTTFGDLLKYLRRRAALTQIELAMAVSYSDTHISHLELNQRLPDLATVEARFVPALRLQDEPEAVARLLELAAAIRREDAPAAGLPPFKGLLFFDEADAEQFYGREALTARLVARLTACLSTPGAPRFLAVVGASGIGKSSVVRAGLVPALRWNRESAGWPMYVLTPTAHPLEALAASFGGEAKSAAAQARLVAEMGRDPDSLLHAIQRANVTHALLVVDQFEELFTLCRGDAERRAFVDNTLTAAFEPNGPVLAVIALRADFYSHCADFPNLREALARHQEYIGGMTAEELQRAIEEPARAGHWEFEPGLVEQMLTDVQGEPGALPLLSHALLETWQRRRGRTFTWSGYAASGGVRGAIAETAETVFQDQLNLEQRAIARHIFLRLTEFGADESLPDTRRRVALGELTAKPEEALAVREVLTLLADARLITTEKETAEVAHEALIREWPTLREWLAEDRAGLRLHRHITETAQEWERAGRAEGELYRGARLAQALEWAEVNGGELNAQEQEFLRASRELAEREAAEREAARQRELAAARRLAETERAHAESERQRAEEQGQHVVRVRTRNRVIAAAGGMALVLAVLAGLFGLQSNQHAAESGQNAATATVALGQSQVRGTQAAQQAQLALNAQATAQAEAKTRAEAQAQAEQAATLSFSRELASAALTNLETNPELGLLLSLQAVSVPGIPIPLEAQNALHATVQASRLRRTLGEAGRAARLASLVFSPDGKRLATGSLDGTVKIWDFASGKELFTLKGHTAIVWDVAFSPDGTRLATASDDKTAKVWDTATGQELLSLTGHTAGLNGVAFSPDGKRLVTGSNDNSFKVWDAATGQELRSLTGHTSFVNSVAFSPDGKRIATGSDDKTAKVWDATTGNELMSMNTGNAVFSVAFSPDNTRLLTASDDQLTTGVAIWDVATGKELRSMLSQNHGRYQRAVFTPDGKYVAAASEAGLAKVWDAASGEEVLSLANASAAESIAISPGCVGPPETPFAWCGRWLATASRDGTAKVYDISPAGNEELLTVPGAEAYYGLLGTRLNVADADGQHIRVWETTPRDAIRELFTLPLKIADCCPLFVDFSPDRTRLVTINHDGAAEVWDAAGRQKLASFPVGADPCCYDIALSPDNARLVTSNWDGPVKLWDVLTGRELLTVSDNQGGMGTAFSPDSTHLATTDLHGLTRIIDPLTGSTLLTLHADSEWLYQVAFSPDGTKLATGGMDATAKIWDTRTGKLLYTLRGHKGSVWHLAFSPDGTRLATGSLDQTAKVWDLTTGQELLTLTGHTGVIKFVAFSPDGSQLATSSTQDGTVRVYLLHLEDLVALAKTRVTRALTPNECRQYLHLDQCPGP